MEKKYIQGNFIPKNKEKCLNTNVIKYRSSWERKFLGWCDNTPAVLRWGYECLPIKYMNPVKKRAAVYYPDFYLEVKDKDEKVIRYIIEVKPSKETSAPNGKSKKYSTNLYEKLTFAINVSKWQAAAQFCAKAGLVFKLVTEKTLQIK